MKKICSFLLILALAFSFVACGGEDTEVPQNDGAGSSANGALSSSQPGTSDELFTDMEFSEDTDNATVNSYGACGTNVTWELYSSGTLVISGTGKMDDYRCEGDSIFISLSPWYSERDQVKKVVVKEGITHIGTGSFFECENLTAVKIAESVTNIKEGAFYGCTKLSSIRIPNSVESLGNRTFKNCTSLTSVALSNKMDRISDHTFENCTSLTNVSIPEIDKSVGSPSYKIGDSAFRGCTSLVSIALPKGIRRIGTLAFDGCTSLADITIPGVFEDDGKQRIAGFTIEGSAFYGCTSLANIVLPEGTREIGSSAFSHCTSLKNIVIPNKVEKIEDQTFWECTSLESITIPNSVTKIESQAFYKCTITSITIPSSVEKIEWAAFDDCTALKDIYFGGTDEQWKKLKVSVGTKNNPVTIHYEASGTSEVVTSK